MDIIQSLQTVMQNFAEENHAFVKLKAVEILTIWNTKKKKTPNMTKGENLLGYTDLFLFSLR